MTGDRDCSLIVITRELAADRPLLSWLPSACGVLSWVKGDEGLVGWGQARQFTAHGPARFVAAGPGLAGPPDCSRVGGHPGPRRYGSAEAAAKFRAFQSALEPA